PDHDDVGILAQNGSQGRREIEVYARVDLCLAYAWQVVFDGVLNGENIGGGGIQTAQCRVERGAFAAAGGASDQDDAMRPMYQCIELLHDVRRHTQLGQLEEAGFLVEQAQHRPLTVPRGQGGNPHVDSTSTHPQGNATILGQTFFRNIQAGHDLDARNQGIVKCAARIHDVAQGAVDPVAHDRMGFKGLQVYVAGPVTHRLGDQGVDHADDGCVVVRLQKVFHFRNVLQPAVHTDLIGGSVNHGGGVVRFRVDCCQQRVEFSVGYLALCQCAMCASQLRQGPGWCAFRRDQYRPGAAVLYQCALTTRPGVGKSCVH